MNQQRKYGIKLTNPNHTAYLTRSSLLAGYLFEAYPHNFFINSQLYFPLPQKQDLERQKTTIVNFVKNLSLTIAREQVPQEVEYFLIEETNCHNLTTLRVQRINQFIYWYYQAINTLLNLF